MKIKHKNHHDNAKLIVYLLVVLLAFGIFLLFNSYQEELVSSTSFSFFMTLAVAGAGLLVGLVYLVSNSAHKVKSHVVKSRSVKGGKVKKRK